MTHYSRTDFLHASKSSEVTEISEQFCGEYKVDNFVLKSLSKFVGTSPYPYIRQTKCLFMALSRTQNCFH